MNERMFTIALVVNVDSMVSGKFGLDLDYMTYFPTDIFR